MNDSNNNIFVGWQNGFEKTKILQGDCLEHMEQMKKGVIKLIVTSPPYYNAREYSQWKTYQDYLNFMGLFFDKAYDVLDEGRILAINTSAIIVPRKKRSERSQRYNIPADLHALSKKFWFVEELIWAKPEGAACGRNRRFTEDKHPLQWKTNPNTERIYIYQKPTKQLNDKIIRSYPNEDVCLNIENGEIWNINPKKSKKHTAPFPNEIPNRLIQLYSWKGDIVYDPFGGEGTTADECEKLGRSCVISELNINYYEVIKEGREKNIIVGK